MKTYQTIRGKAEGLYREKGSKFYAFAHPAWTMEEVKALVQHYRKAHPKARHVCYACILGPQTETVYSSDAGEPSGSAGLPILNQIRSAGLTNVAVVVVRYFGGTKLGLPGLIKAYKQAAADALSNAKVIIQEVKIWFELMFDYARMNDVMNAIASCGPEIVSQDFSENGRITAAATREQFTKFNKLISRYPDIEISILYER